jgi:hypothetical protein
MRSMQRWTIAALSGFLAAPAVMWAQAQEPTPPAGGAEAPAPPSRDHSAHTSGAAMGIPQTVIRGFTDFRVMTSNQKGVNTSLALGELDLYITSQLTPKISFLNETVFKFGRTNFFDVERVLVNFDIHDALQVALGRHHTPIGYWNTAYHHGTLLQPTIQRPEMFKSSLGVLPIHTTGVTASARAVGPLHLGYDVMIGNGIGSTSTADNDNAKSITFGLSSQPTSDLQIGVTAYRDRLSTGVARIAASGAALTKPLDQRAAGGYVSYFGARVELLGEFQRVVNEFADRTARGTTDAGYLYAGVRARSVVTYTRLDRIKFDDTDPYLIPNDLSQGVLGLRYDVAADLGMKVEFQRRKSQREGWISEASAQISLGF